MEQLNQSYLMETGLDTSAKPSPLAQSEAYMTWVQDVARSILGSASILSED